VARPTAIFVLATLFAFAGSLPARAQTPADFAQTLKTGDVVAVTGLDNERIVGRVSGLSFGTITLDLPGGQRTLPASSIGRVVVKDSLTNGTAIGFAIGAGGGAFFGWALSQLCENEVGSCTGAVLGVVALGAGIGAGVGAAADGMHVRTAYRAGYDFPSEFSSEVGIDVGAASIVDHQNRFRLPASVGGSWRYLNASGIGVELNTHRSFGRAVKTTPCVSVNTRSQFTNQCVGPVQEGFGNEITTSGKFVYAFGGSRLRPYISGGAAISRIEYQRPVFFPEGNELKAVNGIGYKTSAQLLAGGGVRIAVTNHISIRPDVTFAFGDEDSRVRASIGVAYRW